MQNAESIFRHRQTILDNLDKILSSAKGSKKSQSKNVGQLSLFGDIEVEKPKLVEYDGHISLMKWVNAETELLGVPITYEPLDEYGQLKELLCTHTASDLLEMVEDTDGIVIMDRVTLIDKRTSKNGNPYAKLYLSQFGSEKYCYLTGDNYKKYISLIYLNEIYLFLMKYRKPTKDFSIDSINIVHVKNVKDIDIDTEIANSRIVSEEKLNEPWMIKNRQL